MYSIYQRERALQLYDQCKSVSKAFQKLGYPTRKRMYDWIAERNSPLKSKIPRKRFHNTPEHPRHPPLQLKLDTIHRCFELGKSVQSVSEEIGYSRSSSYIWRKKYILKGAAALMNYDDDHRDELPEGEQSSSKEMELLKSQIQDMQLEIDILKETLDVLKKAPGVDMTALRNREKALIRDYPKVCVNL